MSELLSCPFCGGEGKTFIRDWDDGTQSLWIECQNCGAEAGHCSNEQEAIEAWNTRAYPYCQFARPNHDEACVLMGELKQAKLNGVNLVPERTCHFIENYGEGCWSKEHRDGKCSICGEEMKGRYNYCPSCGAKVMDE